MTSCRVLAFSPVRASTMRAEIAIFPGVACRLIQNTRTTAAGMTHDSKKSSGPWIRSVLSQ